MEEADGRGQTQNTDVRGGHNGNYQTLDTNFKEKLKELHL